MSAAFNIKIFNNETRQFINEIKASGIVDLDILTIADGENLTADIKSELTNFYQEYCSSYQGPALIYSLALINKRLQFFRGLQTKYGIKILLPIKAMRNTDIIANAYAYVAGFDVANINEYSLLPVMEESTQVFVTSPIFTTDIDSFTKKGNSLCICVDDISQFEELEKSRLPVNYCIRLNASSLLEDYYKQLAEVLPTPAWSRFGVDADNTNDLSVMVNSSKHKFKGFHIHAGMENGNSLLTYLEIAKSCVKLAESLDIRLEYLNLGGGLVYVTEREFDSLLETISTIIPEYTQLFFEPGRFTTKGNGFALGKVASVIKRHDITDVVLDLSAQCHLKWSEPTLVMSDVGYMESTKTVRFFGATCAEPDFIGEFSLGSAVYKQLQKGHVVLFGDITGYSAVWNTSFNGIQTANLFYI